MLFSVVDAVISKIVKHQPNFSAYSAHDDCFYTNLSLFEDFIHALIQHQQEAHEDSPEK